MGQVIRFGDPGSQDVTIVGGKGANLGNLAGAGFTVPPGFTVATGAYAAALDAAGISEQVQRLAEGIDYADVAALESATEKIRSAVAGVAIDDALRAEVAEAYAELGDEIYVAVRSSGTAEDTAAASFAGLHDTYLDVCGVDTVLAAIRDCWASMWSARAVAYRHSNGFDHRTSLIAVVVQSMVEAEVSGVMFTANPLNARTDEIVINASFGLGEAVVSGVVTPDEFTLDAATLAVKRTRIGEKQLKIVRNESGPGTVSVPVPQSEAGKPSLTEGQLVELAELGRRVGNHYDGLPQDIEWAFTDDGFAVLQARPITGVDFTWDEGVEEWQTAPDDEDMVWTYKYSEQYWTGGITPLFYSVRARESHIGIMQMCEALGFTDLLNTRTYKYKYGTAYYGVDVDEKIIRYALPRFARASGAFNVPDFMLDKTLTEPLDAVRFLKMVGALLVSPKSSFLNWKRSARNFIHNDEQVARANGLPQEQLRRLSDTELRRYADRLQQQAIDFMQSLWVGTHVQMILAFGIFGELVARNYKGTNALIGQELMSGLPATLPSEENHEFWELAGRLRSSTSLRTLFEDKGGPEFFAALEDTEEGRAFLADYRAFVAKHAHRGHTDRDLIFPRRPDDPSLDYEAFKMHLQSDQQASPAELEAAVTAKRVAAVEEMKSYLGGGLTGGVKQKLFELVHGEIIDFLVLREDWRYFIDRITYSKRKAFLEVGRRCVERGQLATVEDCFFLGQDELYRVLAGSEPRKLTDAKIAGRRKQFDRMESRMWTPPMLLRGSEEVPEQPTDEVGGDQLVGIGTSGGVVEGRARVVPNLSHIGELQPGEILVCNATDPGWAPVFTIIGGLVIETGGMLAHGSCLSREHGIPAVQLVRGMQLIPTGALIRINGATGEVVILEHQAEVRA